MNRHHQCNLLEVNVVLLDIAGLDFFVDRFHAHSELFLSVFFLVFTWNFHVKRPRQGSFHL